MESCWLLFVVNFLILHTAFLCAQQIDIPLTVEGYTGDDVVLPCRLRSPGDTRVFQMRWSYDAMDSTFFIVYRPPSDVSIPESHLKDRFHLKNSSKDDYSVVIREVVITDGGRYTCSIATFPEGNIMGSTQLLVQERLSPGVGIRIVIVCVTLLSLSILMGAYVVISRKGKQRSSTTLTPVI